MKPAEVRLYDKVVADVGDTIAAGFDRKESGRDAGLRIDEHSGERFFDLDFTRTSYSVPGCEDSINYSFVLMSSAKFFVRPYPTVICPALATLRDRIPVDPTLVSASQFVLDELRDNIEYLYGFSGSSLPVLSGGTYTTGRRTELSRAAAYSDAIDDLQTRFPTSIADNLFDKIAGPSEIEEVCYKALKDVSAWRGDNPIPRICYVFTLYCDLNNDRAAGDRVLTAASNSGLRADIDFPKLRSMLTGV